MGDAIEMSLVEEEDVVEKFAAQGADESLRDGVHIGRARVGGSPLILNRLRLYTRRGFPSSR